MAKRRLIKWAHKKNGIDIRGVAGINVQFISIGQDVTVGIGGGKISSMELIGNMVEIRKADENGKPVRHFGNVLVGAGNAGHTVPIEFDSIMVAADSFHCFGVDIVEDAQPAKPAEEPAKPVQNPQNQQGQQRR